MRCSVCAIDACAIAVWAIPSDRLMLACGASVPTGAMKRRRELSAQIVPERKAVEACRSNAASAAAARNGRLCTSSTNANRLISRTRSKLVDEHHDRPDHQQAAEQRLVKARGTTAACGRRRPWRCARTAGGP